MKDLYVKLLDLIEKYKPVNSQNLAEELKKLQKAFEDSQGKLVDDVGELKEKVSKMSQELLIESTKREQENRVLNDKFMNVESKLESISRDNIRHEESLGSIKDTLKSIDERTLKISDGMISNMAVKETNKSYTSIIITFLVTVLAGLVVAVAQGWIKI